MFWIQNMWETQRTFIWHPSTLWQHVQRILQSPTLFCLLTGKSRPLPRSWWHWGKMGALGWGWVELGVAIASQSYQPSDTSGSLCYHTCLTSTFLNKQYKLSVHVYVVKHDCHIIAYYITAHSYYAKVLFKQTSSMYVEGRMSHGEF